MFASVYVHTLYISSMTVDVLIFKGVPVGGVPYYYANWGWVLV